MIGADSPFFDIAATVPENTPPGRLRDMFQALLEDRFELKFHRGSESRETFALTVDKSGPKLKPSIQAPQIPSALADLDTSRGVGGFFGPVETLTVPSADGRDAVTAISSQQMGTVRQSGDQFGAQRWEASSISMQGLAELLDKAAPLPLPIVDQTRLTDRFEIVLEVSLRDLRSGNPGDPSEMEASILNAFNDGLRRLGLKLEHARGQVETIIVDSIERTPSEN